ncbi:MAG: signal peptidase II [Lachnospiraceae bacterium]|nr:signal peptidase II [Lachnospiraceae bacterium]
MKYITVILGIFGLELGIKNYIEKSLEEGEKRPKCKEFLVIRKYHNQGAFLNMGERRPWIVAALSVILTLLLTGFFTCTFTMAGGGMLKWGLTLMLGGAFGNTYDRLRRKYVVDYVSFNVPFKRLRQIVFNISDFCIMIGAMLSVISEICKKQT